MRCARTSQPRPPTAVVTKQKTPSRRTLTPSRRHRRGACRCSLCRYGVVIENINLKTCPEDENRLVGGVRLLVTNAACSIHPVTRDQKSMRGDSAQLPVYQQKHQLLLDKLYPRRQLDAPAPQPLLMVTVVTSAVSG